MNRNKRVNMWVILNKDSVYRKTYRIEFKIQRILKHMATIANQTEGVKGDKMF